MIDQATIDAIRDAAVPAQNLLIDGTWRQAQDGATQTVSSPINGEPLTTIAAGTAEDVDHAVAAARAAFSKGAWS
ncbi:MAG: aldehyde dehydrogenase family protein, partial [Pseudomonadota bacterium]